MGQASRPGSQSDSLSHCHLGILLQRLRKGKDAVAQATQGRRIRRHAAYDHLWAGGQEKLQDVPENDLLEALRYLQGELGEREFLVGDRLSMADITVGSLMLNLAHCGIRVDAAKYPNIAALHACPSFQKFVESEAAMFASMRG